LFIYIYISVFHYLSLKNTYFFFPLVAP
jgi:hypothetical protein